MGDVADRRGGAVPLFAPVGGGTRKFCPARCLGSLRGGLFSETVELGRWVAVRSSWDRWLGGALAASLIFYLVTNSFSWWTNVGYDKSPVGWWQALTVGMPGFSPTWTFLRASVISDLLFTAVFVAGIEWSARRNPGKVRPVFSAAPVR